jgi:hypothetical protein
MAAYQPGQLYQVPLAELQADPNQPRKYMDPAALEELTASVGQMGIIQPVVCRQDPTVLKTVLIEIARKKQERSMLTALTKYQEQLDKAAAKEAAAAEVPTQRKRTRTEAMNALKDILEPAITRAVNNRGKAT